MSPNEYSFAPFIHQTSPCSDRILLVSFYMQNIPLEALRLQREIFHNFGLTIHQVLFTKSHAEAIDNILQYEKSSEFVITFDIDSVPITQDCISKLIFNAKHHNALTGIAQQSNHLAFNHLYAGPSCCVIPMEIFKKLGRPSFKSTPRSDVGEELTWRAQESNIPVCLLWPTHIEQPKWRLGKDRFGLGTTYENELYHAFETRFSAKRFISRCKSLLEAPLPASSTLPQNKRILS